MDDDLIRELIELQKEENQLLKKYLWRFRFSLLTILLLTTAASICLGVLTYQSRKKAVVPKSLTISSQPWTTSVTGSVVLYPSQPSTLVPGTSAPSDDPFK